MNIVVDELHHWPGKSNIADLPTRGKANYTNIGPDSEWQLGPEVTREPRSQWPASRQFVRGVPQEETRATLYTANLVTKSSLLAAILNLHSLVSEVMQYHLLLSQVPSSHGLLSGCQQDAEQSHGDH